MKYLLFSSLFFLFCGLSSCKQSNVVIFSDFDRGSIKNLIEVKPGYFQGSTKHWLKRDSIGDQYYWFYFKAAHVANKELTFELNDLEGIYRNKPHIVYTDYTQPVFSYDQEKWERMEAVSYDSANRTFTFTQQFLKDPVWIAYAHPYSFGRIQDLLSNIEGNKFVSIEKLADTKEGRPVNLVSITDARVPAEGKKNMLIMAMQHAGEDAGAYLAEGLINYLLSEDERAADIRRKFNFMILPMMNPDGVFNGTSRYNMEMEDLNNIWLNEDKMQAEVQGVLTWLDTWQASGKKVDFFLDIHNHTQLFTYNVFIFLDHQLDSIATSMNKFWPSRTWHSTFQGSSVTYFYDAGIPCGTLELTQSFSESGAYLDIEDYHDYGKGLALGLNDYFSK